MREKSILKCLFYAYCSVDDLLFCQNDKCQLFQSVYDAIFYWCPLLLLYVCKLGHLEIVTQISTHVWCSRHSDILWLEKLGFCFCSHLAFCRLLFELSFIFDFKFTSPNQMELCIWHCYFSLKINISTRMIFLSLETISSHHTSLPSYVCLVCSCFVMWYKIQKIAMYEYWLLESCFERKKRTMGDWMNGYRVKATSIAYISFR